MKKLLPILLLLITFQMVAQNIPGTLSYQGILLQADGITPLTDGNHTVLFRFYTVPTGGTAIAALSRTVTVTTSKGLFTCIIGGGVAPNAPFSAADMTTLSSQQIYMGIGINGGAELAPRAQLSPATYALQAQSAYTVADNSITSAKIVDGTIVNDDISNTAAIAGSKITPVFGAQNISTTGTISGGASTLSRLTVSAGSAAAIHPLVVSGFTGTTRTSATFSDGSNSTFRVGHPANQVVAIGGNIDHSLRLGGFQSTEASFTPWMTFAPNTGNVGIGTSTPSSRLHVQGNTFINGTNTNTSLTPVSSVEFTTGRLGSGALNSGQTNGDISFQFGGTGGGYRHYIQTRHAASAEVNQNAIDFYVNNSTTPAGSVTPNNRTPNGNRIGMSITATGIGIGMSAPNAPLHFPNAVGRKVVLWESGNNDHQFFGLGVGGFGTFNFHLPVNSNAYTFLTAISSTESAELMRIRGNGRVGIGTPDPDQLLTVNGNASKVGGGSWATFSDRRMKKDIVPFNEGLTSILEINPVKFKYNGLGGYDDNGEEYIGVIAQEINQVAPYMIKTIHKKLQESDSDNTELLMYDGTALDYLLINAVKEQQAQIEELKAENQKMQERLVAIEALLRKNAAIEESVAKAEKP
jgi:hypothetical protein